MGRMKKPDQKLAVFYDLSVHPASYDFIIFLGGVEQFRIHSGFAQMVIYVVTGPEKGFRNGKNLENNSLGFANQD